MTELIYDVEINYKNGKRVKLSLNQAAIDYYKNLGVTIDFDLTTRGIQSAPFVPGKPGQLPDPFGIGSLFTGFADFVKAPIDGAIKFVTDEGKKLLDGLFAPPKQNSEWLIDNAPIFAATTAGAAMAASLGIYAATTAGDLLHPIKGTGLVPLGINLVEKLGTGLITTAIAGTFATLALAQPLRYNYNRTMRTYRPSGSIVDQMYFEGHITKEYWHTLYEYQGWPDNLIEAQFKTMFVEPNLRFLLNMFDDPAVDKNWIRKTLKELGLDQASVDVVYQFALRRAADRARSPRITTILNRYKLGYTTKDVAATELRTQQLKPDEISQLLLTADFDKDAVQRKSALDTAERLYIKGYIKDTEFQSHIDSQVADKDARKFYFESGNAKRLEKLKDDKVQKPTEGSTSAAISLYVEGAITQSTLTNELTALNKPLDEIKVLLVAAEQEKRLAQFRDAQKDIKAKKEKTVIGKTTTAVRRYVKGYTATPTFLAELLAQNIPSNEISLLKIEAELQKDENFRKSITDNLLDLFDKSQLNEDQLRAELTPYIVSKDTLEQTILAAKVKLLKKPKSA